MKLEYLEKRITGKTFAGFLLNGKNLPISLSKDEKNLASKVLSGKANHQQLASIAGKLLAFWKTEKKPYHPIPKYAKLAGITLANHDRRSLLAHLLEQ